ncbi:MAG: HAMP domain-containing histidine kinase [Deltaproteobacteria bacterium]|nr:HAMP domain-containing histidine kinase [Deltaproteobacteria bacterium]
MSFDGKLRRYLLNLDRPRVRTIDAPAIRAHFLARVRSLGERGERIYDAWSKHLEHMARFIERVPTFEAPTDPAGAQAWALRCIEAWTGVEEVPAIERGELERITEDCELDQGVPAYALENRLVRDHEEPQLTRLGRVFLRLWGREGVRWLLTVEIAQSRGNTDPFRVSREPLSQLVVNGEIAALYDEDELAHFELARETRQRLVELDVVYPQFGGGTEPELRSYALNRAMEDIVRRAIEPGPWQAMIVAILEDEHAEIVSGGRAVSAAIDTTRLIAHEVRNALVPVRHQIDAIGKQAGSSERLDAARRGVVRVLDFVDQMVATSELVDEEARLVPLRQLVDEAIAHLDDNGGRVEIREATAIALRVPRGQLVRVVVEVIRNALQAQATGRICVSIGRSASGASIVVDDAGPGVAPEDRPRIFDDGFTTRPGGTGFGLALARKIVTDLRGTIRYEDSDLGGARLVIELPSASP